jgi:hypothetical protein
MADLPNPRHWRVPRARLDGEIPTVLRFSNGQRIGANLQVVSVTGGLLSVSRPVVQGSQVKLMFLTGSGSVLGGAEMLQPVNEGLQPFRFVSLADDDQRRLGALVCERSNQTRTEPEWMEKLRATSHERYRPESWGYKIAGAVGLIMTGLATAACLLHFGWLK